jgi:hypothetical protein
MIECVYEVYSNIELLKINWKSSAVYWFEPEVEGATIRPKAYNTASHTHQKVGHFSSNISFAF